MYSFTYEYPTKVFLGEGMTKDHLKEVLPILGGRVLLTTGGGSVRKNGRLDEVLSLLKDSGVEAILFDGIMPNPTYAKVKEGATLARREGVTGILALGGGSVVDASKIIALQATNDDDVWAAEMDKVGKLSASPLPLGAIVTASGTGSEMNGGAVITNEERKLKSGLFADAPRFAFLDYHYMETVPARQVISGAFDTLSHAMETYFGQSDSLNPSDYVALAVMRNTVDNMRRAKADIHDKEARSNLMWDSAMAENGILKVGRKGDFEVHMMEHQLGAYTDCNHGEGLAVLHPVYYRHVYKAAVGKFAAFARVVFDQEGKGEEELALKGIEALQAFIIEMGLPTHLMDLRMKDESGKLLGDDTLRAIAESTVLISSGPRMLDSEEVYQIFKESL